MIRFTDQEIEQLITDDAPVGDLTGHLLGLSRFGGQIAVTARSPLVVSGTEEARRIFEKCGLKVSQCTPAGASCQSGDALLTATGDAAGIHLAWRAAGTMIEFASGIATRTVALVSAAKKGNSATGVAGSRKHAPFVKKMALKALIAGGAVPHRTGLSDTILIFEEHLNFLGGYEKLGAIVQSMRQRHRERMIVVEAHTVDDALAVTRSGAHFVQMDKLTPDDFANCAARCKSQNSRIGMIAAGGIHANNASAYAKAGADVLVTSWMYAGPPADIKVTITPM